MFVGHSHIQSTTKFTSPNGNEITQVNVASLVGYPAPIVNVEVNGDNTLPNLRRDEDNWKVVLIEEEFTKRMFETE